MKQIEQIGLNKTTCTMHVDVKCERLMEVLGEQLSKSYKRFILLYNI